MAESCLKKKAVAESCLSQVGELPEARGFEVRED